MGSEFSYEDLGSQAYQLYSFKYLRTEPCGDGIKGSCFVVDRFPKYANSGYIKQTVWYDSKLRIRKTHYFDRKKKHLKTLEYKNFKKFLGKFWRPQILEMTNHQNRKRTVIEFSDFKFKVGLKKSHFNSGQLKNQR